jgi:hypothetical protein
MDSSFLLGIDADLAADAAPAPAEGHEGRVFSLERTRVLFERTRGNSTQSTLSQKKGQQAFYLQQERLNLTNWAEISGSDSYILLLNAFLNRSHSS